VSSAAALFFEHFFAQHHHDALSSAPMPSLLHEGLIALVRDKPEFAADLLRELLHVEVPKFTEARLAEATLTEPVPTEYHADAVVLLVDGKPVFGIIIGAQLQEDARKRFTWPVYAVNARTRFECPFVVVVVTPDAATALWASQSIELGGGKSWEPFVVGPDGVPIITDPEQARREPELAVLSVMAHGKGDTQTAVLIALAAAASLDNVPDDHRMLYLALIESALSDAARKAFEMLPQTAKLISNWQRGSFEKGTAEGRARGKAEAVLDVLEGRGITVSAIDRERILQSTDLELLKRWLHRAGIIASTDELFV
jgi:hypothetical protein